MFGQSTQPVNLNYEDVQQVAEGLIEGALEVEGLGFVVHCVQDFNKTQTDMARAISFFRVGHIDNIIQGLQSLSEVCIDL
jgi:hypothetical protein